MAYAGFGPLNDRQESSSTSHCVLCISEEVSRGCTDHVQIKCLDVHRLLLVSGTWFPKRGQRQLCDMHVTAMQSSITHKVLWSVSVGFDAPDILYVRMSP